MLSALKNFGVTFLIAALLFGVLAYFATGFVTSTMNSIMTDEEDELSEIMQNEDNRNLAGEQTDRTDEEQTGDEKVPEGESFSFLIITTDYRPDLYDNYMPTLEHMYNTDWNSISASDTRGCLSGEYREPGASSIILVRVDKESGQYTYTYFSPETQVYTTTGYHTFSEVYGFYGKQTLAEHIHVMTGINIKYTILLNAYNFDEFVELCGTPTINLQKDIYRDSAGNCTTRVETTKETVGEDGGTQTEHIPNTLVLSAGEIELNAENFDILNSVTEENSSDVAAKEAWSIEIAKAYLTAIANREDAKVLLTQLITNRSEWSNIAGLDYEEPEETEAGTETVESPDEAEAPVTEPETPTDDDIYNPWEDNDTETDNTADGVGGFDRVDGEGSVDGEETEAEDVINKIWLAGLSEPDGPIIETDYTMNDFDAVRELFEAVTYFDNVSVSYPGAFVEATDEKDAYFDPDLQAGIEKFREYRK